MADSNGPDLPEGNSEPQTQDTLMVTEIDGQPWIGLKLMPEQLDKYQRWADTAGVPLDHFMRLAADSLCFDLRDSLIAQQEYDDMEQTPVASPSLH